MKKFAYFVYVLVFGLMLSSCNAATDTGSTSGLSSETISIAAQNTTPAEKGNKVVLSIMGRDIEIDTTRSGEYYDLDMLTSEFPVDIVLKKATGYEVSLDGVAVTEQITQYQFKKMEHDDNIPLVFKDTDSGEEIINYIRSLPNEMSKFYTIGDGETGKYYFTVAGWLIKMNHDGEVAFYKRTNGCSDFKRYEFDGKIRYTYLELCDSPLYNQIRQGEGPTSRAVIMDETYRTIEEVPYLMPTTAELFDRYPLDDHEFVMLGDGHYIVISYLCKRVNNIPDSIEHSALGARVSAAIIQEIKDGKLLLHWDSTNYPELYAYSVEGNNYYNDGDLWSADYVHINSVAVDSKDENLIASFRDMDAALKINRETGDIIWILGGIGDQFGLTEHQKFSKQHTVYPTDIGTITVFDNGNKNQQTRLLEFKLDESNKKLVEFKEFMMEGQFSPYCGSVQRVSTSSDRFMIGWGLRATAAPLISEIDFTQNKVIFEVVIFTQPVAGQLAYRAYKFAS